MPVDVFATLLDPGERLDPYPTYRAWQAQHPVVDAGVGAWFVFSHEDCLAVLRDKRVSVDDRNGWLPSERTDRLPTLIGIDPPDHDRLRRLVQGAFTPRRVEALRARARELAQVAVASMEPHSTVEVVAELAYPIPLQIICELLGVPEADRGLIREWSVPLAQSIDPGQFRSEALNIEVSRAQASFVEYLDGLFAYRRSHPGDDLLSELLTVHDSSDRMTREELCGLCVLLLVAGHETTVSLVGNGLSALLHAPDQLRKFVDRPELRAAAIDEFLRFDSPVQMTTRIPLEPITVGGQVVPQGHFVILMLGAANRDPLAFEAPDILDIGATRSSSHLAFGNGLHHCLGAALARAEALEILSELVNRFPAIELAAEPTLRPTFVLRGKDSLSVSLGRAK
jgi:cytochrome P450